jgi:hypothetical protein
MSRSDIYCAKIGIAKYSYITKQLHPHRFPFGNHRVQTRRSSLRRRYWMKANFTGRSYLVACFRSYLASGNLFIPIPNSWAENYFIVTASRATSTHDWRCSSGTRTYWDRRLRIVQFHQWESLLSHQRCSNRRQVRLLVS